MQVLHLDAHRLGRDRFQMLFDQAECLLRFLIRHQPHGYLGIRLAGQHRLGPGFNVSAPDAVDVERRPGAGALDDGIVGLAPCVAHACFLQPAVAIKGDPGQASPLLRIEVGHAIVKAGDGDPAVGVVQPGDHGAERVDWVVHRAAIAAGMEIAGRAGHLDLQVRDTAQAIDDGGGLFVDDLPVRDDGDVGRQQLFVLLDERSQAGAPALFFSLKEAPDIDRGGAERLIERLDCGDVGIELALVVRGAAAKEVVSDPGRLKGGRAPEIQRVGRLHVIVAIDQDGGPARMGLPFGMDDRVTGRGHHLRAGESGREQLIAQPAGRSLHVGLVFCLRADAGDAEKLFQFGQSLGRVCACVIQGVHSLPRVMVDIDGTVGLRPAVTACWWCRPSRWASSGADYTRKGFGYQRSTAAGVGGRRSARAGKKNTPNAPIAGL